MRVCKCRICGELFQAFAARDALCGSARCKKVAKREAYLRWKARKLIRMNDVELLKRALEAKIVCHDEIVDAAERRMTTLDNPGFCLDCGHEQDGCEPDARGYECETCGNQTVYGAEELVLMLTR